MCHFLNMAYDFQEKLNSTKGYPNGYKGLLKKKFFQVNKTFKSFLALKFTEHESGNEIF